MNRAHRSCALALLALLASSAASEPPPAPSPLPPPLVDEPDLVVQRIEGACNTWLLTCPTAKAFVAVDPCPEAIEAILAQRAAGNALQAVWITHEHHDHLMGLAPLLAHGKVPVGAHARVREALPRPPEGRAPGDGPAPVLPDPTFEDLASLTLGSLTWQVRHVPGHSPGSLAYVLAGRVAVVGDVLFRGSVGRTDLEGSDPKTLGESLSRALWDLLGETRVLPGHGEPSTIGEEQRTNWLFEDGVREARHLPPLPRPSLGVRFEPEAGAEGLRIAEVVPGSPAASAGLRAGDRVLALDAVEVPDLEAFVRAFRRHAIGDRVEVRYRRGALEAVAPVVLGRRP